MDRVYYEKNKLKLLAQNKLWRINNREKVKAMNRIRMRRVRARNPELARKKEAEYRVKNRESLRLRNRIYQRQWRVKNKEKVNSIHAQWRSRHRLMLRGYSSNYNKQWRKTDAGRASVIRIKAKPCNLLKERLSARIRSAIKLQDGCKALKTIDLIGCSIAELKIWLENQFKPGMTWLNHSFGGWHIDHIIPCSAFDLTDEEQQRKCFHYTNLQPLWALDNLQKSDNQPVADAAVQC